MDMKKSNNKTQIPNKSQNTMTQIPNLFESLEIRIWILFVICYLVLGIFSVMGATVLSYPFLLF
jgi:uncharacterized membrane protein